MDRPAQQRPAGPTIIPPMQPDVPTGQPLNSRSSSKFLKQPSSAPLGGIPGPGSTAPFPRGHGHFPPPGAEFPSGIQHLVNPAEAEMFQNQRVNRFEGNQPNSFPSGSFEKVPFGQPSSMESTRIKVEGAYGGAFKSFTSASRPSLTVTWQTTSRN
ncbi:hypothetical protein HAX54_014479 [Datura stramonium]|uniref:Uncharacterized protein n=1 Tax=Datura stramonium TaxID=4076 RepID=A0ABS8RIU4_DATST|nr:hypothetical protein [Datura stramonium]